MGGKVVQRVIKYIGKEIGGEVWRRVNTKDVRVEAVKRYARMGCPQMGKNFGEP